MFGIFEGPEIFYVMITFVREFTFFLIYCPLKVSLRLKFTSSDKNLRRGKDTKITSVNIGV